MAGNRITRVREYMASRLSPTVTRSLARQRQEQAIREQEEMAVNGQQENGQAEYALQPVEEPDIGADQAIADDNLRPFPINGQAGHGGARQKVATEEDQRGNEQEHIEVHSTPPRAEGGGLSVRELRQQEDEIVREQRRLRAQRRKDAENEENAGGIGHIGQSSKKDKAEELSWRKDWEEQMLVRLRQEKEHAFNLGRQSVTGGDPPDKGGDITKLVAALQNVSNPEPYPSIMRGLALKIPKFGATDEECFSTWLSDFEEHALCLGWSEENKVRSVGLVLSGRARQVIQGLTTTQRQSWTSTVASLKNAFGPTSATRMDGMTRLERVQGKTETVRSYTVDIVQRMQDVGLTAKTTSSVEQSMRMNTYYRGLLPYIRRVVYAKNPTTLEDCEKEALVAEANIRANGPDGMGLLVDGVNKLGDDKITTSTAAKTEEKRGENQQMKDNTQDGRMQRSYDNRASGQKHNNNQYQDRSQNSRRGYAPNRYQEGDRYEDGQTQQWQPRYEGGRNQNWRPSRGGRQTRGGHQGQRRNDGNKAQYNDRQNNRERGHREENTGGLGGKREYDEVESPFCYQCQEEHEMGKHTNPRCGHCGVMGHTRGRCRNF
jgi:hypothetical protein